MEVGKEYRILTFAELVEKFPNNEIDEEGDIRIDGDFYVKSMDEIENRVFTATVIKASRGSFTTQTVIHEGAIISESMVEEVFEEEK